MIDFSAPTAVFRDLFGPDYSFSGAAGGFCPSTYQDLRRQVKVGKSDQREYLGGVLCDPLVADLRVAELALDEAKHVLDPCPDRGHLVVEALVRLGQWVMLIGLERDVPEQARLACHELEFVVQVALAAEHRPVNLAHQVQQLADAQDVGRRHRNSMHKTGIDVGAHVDLHAEVPLVTLLGLMHLGIALLVPALRRAGHVDDRGVDLRAALEERSALLKRVAELEGRRFVRHHIVAQVQPRKAAHRLHFVDRILHRRVGQCVTPLHEVDPQHRSERHRRTTTPARRRVVRLDQSQQRCPGYHGLHLGHETLPTSLLLLVFEGQRGERRLLHGSSAAYGISILPALNRSEVP